MSSIVFTMKIDNGAVIVVSPAAAAARVCWYRFLLLFPFLVVPTSCMEIIYRLTLHMRCKIRPLMRTVTIPSAHRPIVLHVIIVHVHMGRCKIKGESRYKSVT